MLCESDFSIERRVLGYDDQMVDGVQAKTDGVELSLRRQCEGKLHFKSLSVKAQPRERLETH